MKRRDLFHKRAPHCVTVFDKSTTWDSIVPKFMFCNFTRLKAAIFPLSRVYVEVKMQRTLVALNLLSYTCITHKLLRLLWYSLKYFCKTCSGLSFYCKWNKKIRWQKNICRGLKTRYSFGHEIFMKEILHLGFAKRKTTLKN